MDEMENRELMDFETIHEKRSDELTELLHKPDKKQHQRRDKEINEFYLAKVLADIEEKKKELG